MLSKIFRVAVLVPAFWWGYELFSGSVGADPAKALNHAAGEFGLYLLVLNLIVGVLIALNFRFPAYLRFLPQNRRYVGVVCFMYLTSHFFFYLVMEGLEPQAFTQIYTKLYLALGFSAWVILLLLAVTSNNFSVRKLGFFQWKRLHRLVYLAAGLVTVHVLLIEKADLVKFGLLFSVLWVAEILRVAIVWRGRRG